jgi:FAD/FMN-containing dehydrogenase
VTGIAKAGASEGLSAGVLRRALGRGVRGVVIGPDDVAYDDARSLYYTGFDRRPGVIVRPADARDVAAVVGLARESGVELAVRSGGHSVAGHGGTDGGVVLDLSSLTGLELDPAGRTAWAGAGLTAGAYTTAAGTHGLATGFGDAPSVGVGGITLGGGVGFLHRRLGLTVDSLLAAEVVTADGRVVRTDAETEPDLFWAIRGGGGNFGVVSRFRFRLHPVDRVLGGMLILPASPDRIAAFVAEAAAAPDDLSGLVNVVVAPPMPFIPPEHHGRPILMAILVWAGGLAAGDAALAPFRALAAPLAAPLADTIAPMRYPQVYEAHEGPRPVAVTTRTGFVDGLDRAAGEAILAGLEASSAPMRVVQLRVLGGAVARVPAGDTAFAHRHRGAMLTVGAVFDRPEEAPVHDVWATELAASLRQGDPGAYVGFLGDEGPARVRAAYPGATWDRLRAVKARYDPGNLFRLNQNIPPA